MGEIVLVRHGQANSGATSEAEYDRLSELGHRQAGWLGEWLRAHDAPFDTVHTGTMRRHLETAAAMGVEGSSDDRLNELDYFALARDMQVRHGLAPPGPDEWPDHVVATFNAWHLAEIEGTEPFAAFEARVAAVLDEAAQPGRRVLCVTSGGVIAMALRLALGLDADRLARVLLPIHNTSIHRFRVRAGGTHLAQFNATPHFDPPERQPSRTWL
ncbi:histidine phosphatase family protein [Wenxinia saemankumensis]|uniref:Broad specificity phosphatase PhoE n=1 Tax=Wenxinia saemankumensis TaxID=1447782 RepID=A0A1M6E7W6_9RHOB|nr:histidine phosphatase family protein [Wenxinia saemankumensis]SHI81586.1 Broad specificity phosphatase PhoE [Wenxinia saemankumensis]